MATDTHGTYYVASMNSNLHGHSPECYPPIFDRQNFVSYDILTPHYCIVQKFDELIVGFIGKNALRGKG